QELLARLLGTRRATVTEASNQLQDSGVIQSVRGRIRILNSKALEGKACSCYGIITAQQAEVKSRSVTS
ncbi:MAG TPA: helix-turn-helix domain-containing protein, partial [Pyrinomonadaceae bacterium]